MNRAITLFLLAALSVLPVLSALRQGGHKTSEATNANGTLTLELALEVDNDAVYAAGSVGDARLLVSLNMAASSVPQPNTMAATEAATRRCLNFMDLLRW